MAEGQKNSGLANLRSGVIVIIIIFLLYFFGSRGEK